MSGLEREEIVEPVDGDVVAEEDQEVELQVEESDIDLDKADEGDLIHDKMKKKTQKRIVSLVQKNKEKEKKIVESTEKIEALQAQIEELVAAHRNRETRETVAEYDARISQLKAVRDQAINDPDAFAKADQELLDFLRDNQRPSGNTDAMVDDPNEYFRSKYSWYGKHEAMSRTAESISAEIFGSSKYNHLNQVEKLKLVGEKTLKLFKNKNRDSQPTDGIAGTSRPQKQTVKVMRSDLDYIKRAHPGLSDEKAYEMAKELKESAKKKGL